MKTAVLSILVFLLASCATTENYRKILDSWIGHPVDELINAWGYPTGDFEIPKGNKVYRWEKRGLGISYKSVDSHWISDKYELWCNTYFEVDKNNIIVGYRFEGNDCISYR